MRALDDPDRPWIDGLSPQHRRPALWRCWITSGLTVVALTVTSLEAHRSGRLARLSRFSPTETVERLSAHASTHGLSVFARIPLHDREGRGEWLVLGLAEDETAIVQNDDPDPVVSLPLTMRITAEAGGGSRIQFHALNELPHIVDGILPPQLLARLEALPALLDDALG